MLGNGKCKCITNFERDTMLNSLKRSMRDESNILEDIKLSAEEIKKRGRTIIVKDLLDVHTKTFEDFEKVKNIITITPVCDNSINHSINL